MLKKFLIGTIAVLALGVFLTASAMDFGTTTLRVGSRGEAVKTLQTLVGATPVDGVFGNMTKAKVMAWQSNNGLTADGVFGPASKAKANATVTTTYPAGCTSATGFSSTTGLPCSTVSTLPAGCTSTVGFSSTTGAKCDGGSTVVDNGGPLTGGAGDISITGSSTDVEDQVVEGKTENVLAFKVEATDSDVALKNVKLTLENMDDGTPLSSYRLNRYADGVVSVYMGSTKVGEANVEDFTKNNSDTDHDNTYYTKSISLSNAVVRMGSSHKATFYVKMTAVSNIDSNDEDNSWTITASDVRFQDATGVIMTSGDSAENTSVNFADLSTAGDVKLTVSKGSATPVEGNVEVSDSSSTSDVLMLEFKLKATGTDMDFDQVDVDLSSTTGTVGPDMIGELVLKNGSDELASIDGSDLSGDETYSFDLDNTFNIDQDSTETFRVYAKINKIDNGTFEQSDNLKVVYNSTNMEDVNGDVVDNLSGSAAGNYQTFYSEGINASAFVAGTPTTVTSTTGTTISASYPISFKITAFGNPYYILKTGLASTGDNADFADLSATNATEDGDYWLVEDGDTATFTTTGVIASGSGFQKIVLDTLSYDTDAGTDTDTSADYTFTPSSSYQTPSVFFNS